MPETALSPQLLYNARPTLRLAGQADERLSQLLLGLCMEEGEGGMSRLELRLSNLVALAGGGTETAFGPGSDLRLGAALAVYAGDVQSPVAIFDGRVSALELLFTEGGVPELNVLAEDALQTARLARRSRVFTRSTPADVVRTVAQDLGLRPAITGLQQPSGTWAQVNQSDLAFLRQLLARFDADLQVVGDELQVAPRGDVARGQVELALFGQLQRARVVADLSQQATRVSASGWNPVDGRAVRHEADAPTHAGPGQGRSGAQWLADTLGERSEHVGHLVVSSDDEARAVATAAFDQRARRFVRLEGVAQGNPAIRVGTTVAVSGLSGAFDNRYYVSQATHRFDAAQGYRTEFVGECAWLGEGAP